MTTSDTKKAASAMRRCQKRVSVIGCMMPPMFTTLTGGYYDDYGFILQVVCPSTFVTLSAGSLGADYASVKIAAEGVSCNHPSAV